MGKGTALKIFSNCLLLCALFLTACSGGGGGDAAPAPAAAAPASNRSVSLSGDYASVGFEVGGNTVPVDWRAGTLVHQHFVDASSLTADYTVNSSSDASVQTGSATMSYSADSSGDYSATDPNSTVHDGSMNAAGDIGVDAIIRASNRRGIEVMVKKGGSTFSNSCLYGTYHFSDISQTNASNPRSEIGSFYFDGVGNYTFSGTYSTLNVAADVGRNGGGTYSVNPDGTFTLDGGQFSGVMKDSGDVLVFSYVKDVSVQMIFFAVKAGGNTYTNSSLNGTYYFNEIDMTTTDGTYSGVYSINFDGAGGYTGTAKISPTTGTAPLTGTLNPGTYTVKPNGTGAVYDSIGGDTTEFAISSNGKSIVAAIINDSTDIAIGFAVKK